MAADRDSYRLGWQGELAGYVYGEGWQHPRHADFPWGVIVNPETGEIFAVEILSPEKAGRVILLATVPPIMRGSMLIHALMHRAYRGHAGFKGGDSRNLFFLAGYLYGVADWIDRPALSAPPVAPVEPPRRRGFRLRRRASG